MRKFVALGAGILLASSVGMAGAQERLPQHSGFGTGVGESAGTGTRSQVWDKNALLERLSQLETISGRVLAIDLPAGKIFLETGGSSHDEGRAGAGAMSAVVGYFDDKTNMDNLKIVQTGDDVMATAAEVTSEKQPFGTGKKMIRDITVIRGNEKLAGFGGLGQRPDPRTERGIVTESGSNHGGVVGQILPGAIQSGITSSVGEMTGAAPCWQCEPQPGWGFGTQNRSDYGTGEKPNLVKQ